jgi:hypothetical protein
VPCLEWQLSLHALLLKHITPNLDESNQHDNVYQGSKIVFGDDNIHSSSCVVAKKMKSLSLYMGFTL